MHEDSMKQQLLSQIIQGSPIPPLGLKRSHPITHCNTAYEKLAGVPLDKIIGSPSHRFARGRLLADFIVDGADEGEIDRHYGGKYRRSMVVEGAYEAEEV